MDHTNYPGTHADAIPKLSATGKAILRAFEARYGEATDSRKRLERYAAQLIEVSHLENEVDLMELLYDDPKRVVLKSKIVVHQPTKKWEPPVMDGDRSPGDAWIEIPVSEASGIVTSVRY